MEEEEDKRDDEGDEVVGGGVGHEEAVGSTTMFHNMSQGAGGEWNCGISLCLDGISTSQHLHQTLAMRKIQLLHREARMNERQMQSKEGKVDSSKALNAILVVRECSGTKSDKVDISSRFGNDTHVEDVDIKPMNAKSQWLRYN
nr:hypothetical protein [Tanacetum cinerariifolium]